MDRIETRRIVGWGLKAGRLMLLAVLAAACGETPTDSRATAADRVFIGGRVYTVDATRPWAEAVAVRDDRIVGVGTTAEIESLVGPATEVVDLEGRMMLPAFQDTHVHPMLSGVATLECDLSSADDLDAYRAAITAYAQAHPELPWIVGRGWSTSVFGPGAKAGREILDALVPDRPVYLKSIDGHTGWANSKALEIAGIESATPDPPGGFIDRDPRSGLPIGTLQERAQQLVEVHIPPAPIERRVKGLRWAMERLHEVGIVSIQDAKVTRSELEAYSALEDRGELRLRVFATLLWDGIRLDSADELIALRSEFSDLQLVRPSGIKIFLDGVMENYTAAMLVPYLIPSRTRGLLMVDSAVLEPAVERFDASGFGVHFHAIGDAAVRQALDAVEEAGRLHGPSDNRHTIAHLQMIDPDDIPRFADLGVTASFQPIWAYADEYVTQLTLPFIGRERARWMYPIRSVIDAGGRVAFGSDWPVSTPDPLPQIETALTRRDPSGEPTPILNREERIELDQALRAFTIEAAYANRLERETGSVEVGKLADLIVLDRDLFAIAPREISEVSVVLTLFGGDVVYGDPGAL